MKQVILAPHIDDEMIGCWSVLNTSHRPEDLHVFYFYELSSLRKDEARAAALLMHFTPHWGEYDSVVNKRLEDADEVYVPARWDHHVHHRAINQAYRDKATHFYSVDMVNALPLADGEMRAKHRSLHACYPSQAQLWNGDAKYYLFESIHRHDFEVYKTIKFQIVSVTVLEEYANDVTNWLQFHYDPNRPQHSFSEVLSIAVRGEVTMHTGDLQFKARQTS